MGRSLMESIPASFDRLEITWAQIKMNDVVADEKSNYICNKM